MSVELEKISVDKDLVVLDTMVDDGSLPQRDWESIINIYNQDNSSFPITPLACAKLIAEIKEGIKPSTAFRAKGISYKYFIARYSKIVSDIEELYSKNNLTSLEYQMILSLRHNPYFILGNDLERVRAHKFNELQLELRQNMMFKPETFLTYMKEFHSEGFEEKEEKKEAQVVINFGVGILESI